MLHGVLILLLLHIPTGGNRYHKGSGKQKAHTSRLVSVKRQPKKQNATKQAEKEQKEKPFAKTSSDTPQQLPKEADFEGRHNTRAASDPNAGRERRQDKEAPAQDGEAKKELVTFDQERQEGDLEHDGKRPTPPPTPPVPPTPQQEMPQPPAPPPAQGTETGTASTVNPLARDAADQETRSTPTITPQEADDKGHMQLRQNKEHQQDTPFSKQQQAAAKGTPNATGKKPSHQQKNNKRQHIYFDPSLAYQPSRPGFRTNERRTRSSGRFIVGRGAALNVAATPRGRYESEIYRRIAWHWYRACDEHRGDIIPGSITISIRINKNGRLENMDLITRRGASMTQQAFTFRSIRRATLPAMPTAVKQDVVGRLLELIFTFNFD